MLKKIILTAFIVPLSLVSKAQNFEGTLVYSVNIELGEMFKTMGVTIADVRQKMEDEGAWFDTIRSTYKGSNYINVLNSVVTTKTIYKADSNKLFTFADSICMIMSADDSNLEEAFKKGTPKVFKRDTSVEINGKKCNVVRVEWKKDYIEYFYNENTYPMEGSLYKQHKQDGWGDYLAIANALPLKIVKTSSGTYTTLTLVKAEPKTVSDTLFAIPELVEDEDLSFFNSMNIKAMKIK